MWRSFISQLIRSGSERAVRTGTVDPPNVLQSVQGRYYVGRTGLFAVPAGHEALVLFRTPADGTRRLFVVSITVTSSQGRRAICYFGPETSLPVQPSGKLASAHRGSPDQPQATIEMVTAAKVPLRAGAGVLEWLLAGGDTLVLEQQGRLILEPGEAIGVWFEAVAADDEIDLALGWWEEALYP